ncbi:GNAT family N-acetyltransferase [Streptomyces sp. NPDC051907]|uniref:GNAT family N-acetyltransferase n=1 Tax=Streptomyces sp. NPDC051907 TaxID=3155284 RepID=UPI003432B87B
MTVLLETDRLRLRAFADSEADVERLYALDSDPEVMQFLNGGKPTTREALRSTSLPRLLHEHPCIDSRGFWAAEDRGTGDFLGWFEFRPLREDSSAEVELGYRLGRTAWGRGLATEGCLALIRKGFTELGVERVTADTMAVNGRSRRVMEKSGLIHVRTYFQDWPDAIEGSEFGEVEYALTRADWELRESGRTGLI